MILAILFGSMTFCLNPFRLKGISSNRHFVEYDISSKFRRDVSKFVLKCLMLICHFFRLDFVYKERQVINDGSDKKQTLYSCKPR